MTPEQIAIARVNTMPFGKRRNKYNARKVTVDGRVFHSAKEAGHYATLRLREKCGEIRDLVCQHRVDLFAHDLESHQAVKVITYIMDFTYYDLKLAKQMFVDVKGVRTAEFIIKKKMFEACYGETLTEV